ncbi:MAG TPA: metallophosphoesterase [Egibacteraceae bacterium]|nr:metallophosphoesterase [Egibacteraceae bacterium]
MIRIAAVGDVHLGTDSAGTLAPHLRGLGERADVLCLAGDLTRHGEPDEAAVLADELRSVDVPVVCVLGNHDYQTDQEHLVRKVLEEAGVTVLEGERTVIDAGGRQVGIAGTKGFGGGFMGASASDFGEPEQKAFVRHSRVLAESLERELRALDTEVKVALMHFSPVPDTLQGERLEIYPFLGSYFLAEAVDRGGADLALHGHAHAGTEKGRTAGGVPVRNVAQPVIRHAYKVYCLGDDELACEPER